MTQQTAPPMPAIVIDFEATETSAQAEATEIGYCSIVIDASHKALVIPLSQAFSVRCKPDRPITYGSMAVTGICPEDVENEDSHRLVVPRFMPVGEAYVIGHNVDYDIQVAKNAGVDVSDYKSICTLAIARHLYPEAEHKLTALLYMLDYEYARACAQHAHSAAHDVRFCVRILRIFCKQVGITDMQSLYELSEIARTPIVMPMGKHKGENIEQLASTKQGRSYLFWVIGNIDDNPYLTKLCRKLLIGSTLRCKSGNADFRGGDTFRIARFITPTTIIVTGYENFPINIGISKVTAASKNNVIAIFEAE